MSSSVESRIVSMKFDNTDFQRGVSSTLSSLGTLSKALDAGFTSKAVGGLSRVGSAIRGFSFGNMGASVDGISGKFIALSTIAVTALSRITNSAISAGINFAKQFSGLQAAQQGFAEYETKLGSIQTILANTGRDLNNQSDLNEVTQALDELNRYSDKTIYNFGEMARNIGTFTAAGVDLETSVNSIKGIANIAALSGSNAQQASTAMYQLSQAIAAGKVGLQDWNSVVNAGMGGKVFQTALTNTAVAMGKIDESAVRLNKETGQMTINGTSFRESISAIGEEKWLTGDVLTNTLAQFSGDLTDAQLKAQGFNAQQIQDIRDIANTAVDAATKVKTITQLIGTVKEAMASGWAKTFEIIIGDFGEAKTLFTNINNVVGGFIQKQADARNKVLEDWKALGGRDDLLSGLENLFRVFLKIARPIRNAFRDIFPPATGETLKTISQAFEDFTEGLLFGAKHSKNIREIFRGIFTIFRVGIGIIGGIIRYVAEFFGIIINGGGGDALGAILGLVSGFANMVTWLGKWLEEGEKIGKFFDVLIAARNAVLEPLVGAIGAVVEALVALVSGDVSGFFTHLEDAGNSLLDVFDVVGEKIGSFIENTAQFFAELGSGGATALDAVTTKIAEFVQNMADFFSELGSGGFDALASVFENIGAAIDNVKNKLNFGDGVSVEAGGLSAVGEGLNELSWIATAFGAVWRTLGSVFGFVGDTITAVAPRLWKTLGIVGDKFLTFIENMDVSDLIAIINTGVFIMLYKAFRDLAKAGAGLLNVGDSASGAFDQLTDTLSSMQSAIQAQLIMSIAIAVALLAASLIALSLVPADKLKSSGAAIAGMITGLVAAIKVLTMGGGKSEIAGEVVGEDLQLNLISVAAAMIGMATAILILAGALKILETVEWSAMGKLGALMAGIVAAMVALGAAGPVAAGAGAAIFLMAGGMVVLAAALELFEGIEWESIGKMAVILTALATALAAVGNPVIGPLVLAGAAAMFIMAPALMGITAALLLLQLVDWSAIGKLALVLTTLALGVTAMIAALPGALAIGVLATGLTLLMPVLQTLGEMDLGTFTKALGLLIIALVTLGGTSAMLGILSPLIAAFGLALTAVGVAMILVGTGTLAFATGLGLLAATGAAAFAVLLTGITSFLAMLPQWILQFKQTLDAIIFVLRETGPPFIRVMGELMRVLAREVVRSVPELQKAAETLIEAGLRTIRNTSDDFTSTGIKLILDLLGGLSKNMGKLTDKGTEVIVKFLEGIQKNDDEIAREGRQTVESLIRAMGRELINLQGGLIADFLGLGRDLVQGIAAGVSSFASSVGASVLDAVSGAWDSAMNWLQAKSPSRRFMKMGKYIDQGLAVGLDDNAGEVSNSAVAVAQRAHAAMSDTLSQLSMDALGGMSFDPTIRPILDLSDVETEAGRLSGLLTPSAVSAGVSLAEAQLLADELISRSSQNGGDSETKPVKEITFNQNLYSPKAINAGEHYRQTKNLLSLRRKELNLE